MSELRDVAEAINVAQGLTPEDPYRLKWVRGTKRTGWPLLVKLTCMECGAVNEMCGCGRRIGLFESIVRAARAMGL